MEKNSHCGGYPQRNASRKTNGNQYTINKIMHGITKYIHGNYWVDVVLCGRMVTMAPAEEFFHDEKGGQAADGP